MTTTTKPNVDPPHPDQEHMADLEIRNLHVQAGDKKILKGLDLTVNKGEIHALMGPNGSGKSTLANVIMGQPNLEVTEGQILFRGEDITEADPDERARAGLFMAFQYPVAIPGVTVTITNTDTGLERAVVTNENGLYRAPLLPLGTYKVVAELQGFKKYEA